MEHRPLQGPSEHTGPCRQSHDHFSVTDGTIDHVLAREVRAHLLHDGMERF